MASKQFNFNVPILDLEDKPNGEIVGRVFAQVLAMQTKGDALKYMSWALDLIKNKPIDLDQSDTETLKTFVNQNEQMTNLLKYHILTILNT